MGAFCERCSRWGMQLREGDLCWPCARTIVASARGDAFDTLTLPISQRHEVLRFLGATLHPHGPFWEPDLPTSDRWS